MVKDLMKPGDWLAKIDAYFLIPIDPQLPEIPPVSVTGQSIPVSKSAI